MKAAIETTKAISQGLAVGRHGSAAEGGAMPLTPELSGCESIGAQRSGVAMPELQCSQPCLIPVIPRELPSRVRQRGCLKQIANVPQFAARVRDGWKEERFLRQPSRSVTGCAMRPVTMHRAQFRFFIDSEMIFAYNEES